MTLQQVEMTCPYDGTRFTATLQASGTGFEMALDFRVLGAIQSPSPLAVCPTNGFVFFKPKISEEELERLRPFVLSHEFQALGQETPYYRAAWLLERSDAPRIEVTWSLLQATWESYEAPERYTRYAGELVARLADEIAEATGGLKIRFELLLGEMFRRLERFDQAKDHFSRFLSGTSPNSDAALIARHQLTLIDRRDSAPHFASEAIKQGDADPDIWLARRTPTLSDNRVLKQERLVRASTADFIWRSDGRRTITSDRGRLIEIAVSGEIESGVAQSLTPHFLTRDGKKIVAGLHKDRQWSFAQLDAETFGLLASAPAPSWSEEIALSFDGKVALATSTWGSHAPFESKLVAYDLDANQVRLLTTPTFSQGSKAFWLKAADPSGPRVVLLHDETLIVWDYEQGNAALVIRPDGWTRSMTRVRATFSADGARLFVAADDVKAQQCAVSIWDTRTGARLAEQRVPGLASRLSISADERLVALGCERSLTIWDGSLATRVEAMTLPGNAVFGPFAFSPDGRILAVSVYPGAIVFYAVSAGN